MKAKLIGLVIIVLGLGAGWYVIKGGTTVSTTATTPTPLSVTETVTSAPTDTTTPATDTTNTTTTTTVVTAKATVSYTDSGFTPKIITVKKGTSVSFVNNSSGSLWVASDPHPTHSLLPGFDALQTIVKGTSYDYTFIKVGTWTYHNHMKTTDRGTVVVTE